MIFVYDVVDPTESIFYYQHMAAIAAFENDFMSQIPGYGNFCFSSLSPAKLVAAKAEAMATQANFSLLTYVDHCDLPQSVVQFFDKTVDCLAGSAVTVRSAVPPAALRATNIYNAYAVDTDDDANVSNVNELNLSSTYIPDNVIRECQYLDQKTRDRLLYHMNDDCRSYLPHADSCTQTRTRIVLRAPQDAADEAALVAFLTGPMVDQIDTWLNDPSTAVSSDVRISVFQQDIYEYKAEQLAYGDFVWVLTWMVTLNVVYTAFSACAYVFFRLHSFVFQQFRPKGPKPPFDQFPTHRFTSARRVLSSHRIVCAVISFSRLRGTFFLPHCFRIRHPYVAKHIVTDCGFNCHHGRSYFVGGRMAPEWTRRISRCRQTLNAHYEAHIDSIFGEWRCQCQHIRNTSRILVKCIHIGFWNFWHTVDCI